MISESSDMIGGGAINEKPRTYNPSKQSPDDDWDSEQSISHLLHAVVGLHRYPNYLSRFQDINDIDHIENSLQHILNEVREQKSNIIERRKDVNSLVSHYNKSNMSMKSEVDKNIDSVCGLDSDKIWYPELAVPKSWVELKSRNILNENAFKAAFQSMKMNTYMSCELGDIISGKVSFDLDPALLEELMDQEMFDVYSFPLLSVEVSGIGSISSSSNVIQCIDTLFQILVLSAT